MENSGKVRYIPQSVNFKRKLNFQHFSSTNYTNQKSSQKECGLCLKTPKRNSLTDLVNNRLYNKYSSSQDYYYLKDINAILQGKRVPSAIVFKDVEDFLDVEEVQRRFYFVEEYPMKIEQLAEYYKYHREIPRIFT